jgi:ABC-type bacteriocin/lantibiotic exporter with double-glycine peptidase domain
MNIDTKDQYKDLAHESGASDLLG